MELHTLTHGTPDQPTVAFCHGLFGQGKNWTTAAKGLLAQEPPYGSLLIDMPNHGRSPWSDRIDQEAWADDVAATIAARVDTVDLVGHSMGAKIAMLVALRHPELIHSLVVVDMSPVNFPLGRAFTGYVEAMQSIDLDTLAGRADADAKLQPMIPDPVVRPFLLQNLRRTGDEAHPWRWQMNLDVLGSQLEVLGTFPQVEDQYHGPVLWIGGANSDYVQDAYRPEMTRLFPRVGQITVKDAGHWVHSEQPEVFQNILSGFLAKYRDEPTGGRS